MLIYKTTNLINGKFYIGKDSKENPDYLGSGLLLKKAINKYGIKNFKKEVIEFCDSKQQLDEREIYWIDKLDAKNNKIGYNIATGGSGGDTISNNPKRDLISKHISQSLSGRKFTEKHKDNIRKKAKESFILGKRKNLFKNKNNKGINNGMYGHKHTKETKSKMSKLKKGIPLSENHKKSLSLVRQGKQNPNSKYEYVFKNKNQEITNISINGFCKQFGFKFSNVYYHMKNNTKYMDWQIIRRKIYERT